jgi:hypothetical protein
MSRLDFWYSLLTFETNPTLGTNPSSPDSHFRFFVQKSHLSLKYPQKLTFGAKALKVMMKNKNMLFVCDRFMTGIVDN